MGLTWVELTAGKREGRRFRGQYVVTQNDVMPKFPAFTDPQDPALFWDRVSYSGWPFDLRKCISNPQHNAISRDVSKEGACNFHNFDTKFIIFNTKYIILNTK